MQRLIPMTVSQCVCAYPFHLCYQEVSVNSEPVCCLHKLLVCSIQLLFSCSAEPQSRSRNTDPGTAERCRPERKNKEILGKNHLKDKQQTITLHITD